MGKSHLKAISAPLFRLWTYQLCGDINKWWMIADTNLENEVVLACFYSQRSWRTLYSEKLTWRSQLGSCRTLRIYLQFDFGHLGIPPPCIYTFSSTCPKAAMGNSVENQWNINPQKTRSDSHSIRSVNFFFPFQNQTSWILSGNLLHMHA